MKLTVTVCNVCQDPTLPTEHFQIRSQGKVVDVDLCEQHAQPFEAYLREAKPRGRAAAKKSATKKTAARRRVMTIEEIEAQKKGR